MKYRLKVGLYNEKYFTKENRDVFIKEFNSMEELIAGADLLEECNVYFSGNDMVYTHERLSDDCEWEGID